MLNQKCRLRSILYNHTFRYSSSSLSGRPSKTVTKKYHSYFPSCSQLNSSPSLRSSPCQLFPSTKLAILQTGSPESASQPAHALGAVENIPVATVPTTQPTSSAAQRHLVMGSEKARATSLLLAGLLVHLLFQINALDRATSSAVFIHKRK